MRTSKAGSSPFLCHALCNSPRSVFHKCIPKLSRWIRAFSFFPLFSFPVKKTLGSSPCAKVCTTVRQCQHFHEPKCCWTAIAGLCLALLLLLSRNMRSARAALLLRSQERSALLKQIKGLPGSQLKSCGDNFLQSFRR